MEAGTVTPKEKEERVSEEVSELLEKHGKDKLNLERAREICEDPMFAANLRLFYRLGSAPTLAEFMDLCFRQDYERREFLHEYPCAAIAVAA